MQKNIEVLAPAGSFESLTAAIKAGANAVYFGAGNLNMRSKSSFNFSKDDIVKIVKFCNKTKVKSYLTLNTIIYDNELEEARDLLNAAKEAKVSAVIASDIAIIQMAYEIGIPVHISVQANVCNIEAIKFFSKFADVMVLARELSLHQIKDIVNAVEGVNGGSKILGPSGNPVRIEVFAHGALCISVSGKCFMSQGTFCKSANRGACIQNCRRKYKVIDEIDGKELLIENNYIMSPKDICLIRHLDTLLNSGVSILKIEGRGRSADYVYTVVKAYREAVGSIIEGNYTENKIDKWEEELKTVFNRGFWHGGHYLGNPTDMWCEKSDNQASLKKTRIGVVNKYFSKIQVSEIELKEGDLSVGDNVLIIGPTTGVVKLQVPEIRCGKPVEKAFKGDVISVPVEVKVRKNDQVYLQYKDELKI